MGRLLCEKDENMRTSISILLILYTGVRTQCFLTQLWVHMQIIHCGASILSDKRNSMQFIANSISACPVVLWKEARERYRCLPATPACLAYVRAK